LRRFHQPPSPPPRILHILPFTPIPPVILATTSNYQPPRRSQTHENPGKNEGQELTLGISPPGDLQELFDVGDLLRLVWMENCGWTKKESSSSYRSLLILVFVPNVVWTRFGFRGFRE
jgi:hypothetical protein